MSKRTIIISAVCLLLVLGVGGYFIFSHNSGSTQVVPVPNTPGNPFGTAGNAPIPKSTSASSSVTVFGNTKTTPPILEKLVDSTVTAGTFIESKNASLVYFMDKATGNVYTTNTLLPTIVRKSNTTIPRVLNSLWSSDGNKVIMNYLADNGDITTYDAHFSQITTASSTKVGEVGLTGTIIQKNLEALVLSPSTTRIFYLVQNSDNTTTGYIANFDGSKPVTLFNSPLKEWLVYWPTENTIVIATKPSSYVVGYSYSINTKTGAISPLIHGINGLTVLPNSDLSKIAYSDDSGRLKIFTVKDQSSIDTNVATLPDKCVWSKKNTAILYCSAPSTLAPARYPDDWYQGTMSFTDSIYKVNTATNIETFVVKPFESYHQDIDGVDLSLNQQESYLLLSNKKDSSLWAVLLNQ